ncbi:MAG: H4MPT-linked C1 transfer pathway protein [Methanospirillaceae archaeon]|nr:H4MPT-linked C1 transfer pathway protein [Methanospirillaceae archaeon]
MLGIDIGGANLKIITDNGMYLHYCPLYRDAPLQEIIQNYATGTDSAAVVMSGELADCFPDKDAGISHIVNRVKDILPHACFYGIDGLFHTKPGRMLAAANWLASADFLKEIYPRALFVDIGSTTTDIIPLPHFFHLKNQTDLTRLQNGFLVYTGILRTPVSAVTGTLLIGGIPTPVSSEYFATTADAWLVSGKINESLYTCETADKAGTTSPDGMRRLARVVCCDLRELSPDQIREIADEIISKQVQLIAKAVDRIKKTFNIDQIITAGIGAPLLSHILGAVPLKDTLGEYADALPAYAVREVFLRNQKQ